MVEWNAGYVADVEYQPGFFRQQTPAHLDLVCLLNGVEPPDSGAGFAWCELGCGQGITASVVAAAAPEAAVHAVDFHPAHIARARTIATEAGLANIAFHECSFGDLADGAVPGLPAFDYVTLHGVYSWVGPEIKRAIVRFLARAVKPGGVVYITYNTVPGWAEQMPLQRMLLEHARDAGGRSDRAVLSALDFAQALLGAGAAAVGSPTLFERLRDPRTPASYLAHEYLNGAWQPLLHIDVVRDLGAAKLTYAGSAHLFSNEPSLMLTTGQREVLGAIANPALRESFADYCGVETHRCDVFVRGARPLTPAQRDARLRDVGLALAEPLALPHTIEGQGTPIVLGKDVYAPIFAALEQGPCRVGDLLDLPGVRAAGAPSARQAVLALVGTGAAVPMTRPVSAVAAESAVRFNRSQVAGVLAGRSPVAWLAGAVGGAGLAIDGAGAQLHRAVSEGGPTEPPLLVDHVLGPLPIAAITGDPDVLQAEVQRRMELAQGIDHALRRSLPAWRRLGMI